VAKQQGFRWRWATFSYLWRIDLGQCPWPHWQTCPRTCAEHVLPDVWKSRKHYGLSLWYSQQSGHYPQL